MSTRTPARNSERSFWEKPAKRREKDPPQDPSARRLVVTVVGDIPFWISNDESHAMWNARDEDGRNYVIQGALARLAGGEMLNCEGRWKNNPKHGWSFHVDAYVSALPQSVEGIQRWLETRVRGIGPTFAKAITDQFGEKAFEAIDANPEVLYDLKSAKGASISRKQVEKVIQVWDEAKYLRQVETFLFSNGVSAKLADKLYRRFGDEVIDVLSDDPYRITEVKGVGFKIADGIALKSGVGADDPKRIRASIGYVLEEAESDGHVFLGLEQFHHRAVDALGISDPAAVSREAQALAKERSLIVEADDVFQQRVYRRKMWGLEVDLARMVRALLEPPTNKLLTNLERPVLPEGMNEDEARAAHIYVPTDEQWSAVEMAANHRLSLLTGGPGVGKCIGPETPVLVDGTLLEAGAAWSRYAGETTWDGEGEWSIPTQPIMTASLMPDGSMAPASITRLYRQRVKETLRRVVLDDGSELLITRRHRLFGLDGWTNDLRVGDKVAVPRSVPWQGTPVDHDLTVLLAWQIAEGFEEDRLRAEGSSSRVVQARITQSDADVLRRVRRAAAAWSKRTAVPLYSMPITQCSSRAASELRISSAAYRDWLIEHGYQWGRKSAAKRIPDFIVSADDETIALFLREFFSAEGSVNTGPRSVEISSASRTLMWQLGLMLRRLGIWMRVRHTRKAATNGSGMMSDYWSGRIGGVSLRLFAQKVGFSVERKQQALGVATAVASNPNLELIPSRDLFAAARRATGLSRHQLRISSSYLDAGKDAGEPVARAFAGRLCEIASGRAQAEWEAKPRNRYTDSTAALYAAIDRDEVADLASALEERIDRDVWFARITRIEDVEYEGEVFDFEVAGPHNYVACNVLAHNTASMDMILHAATKANKKVLLAAPTGKAARRMTEITGAQAKTIHRLLEWSPMNGGFQRNADDPLEADLVICDEASMLSLDLADALLSAIGPNTHLLLVGDPDQLPPVGAGKVLSDLLECANVPRTHLSRIFRQAAGSMIITNAHRINHGQIPFLRHDQAEAEAGRQMIKDFFWVGREKAEQTAALTVEFAAERIPRTFNMDPARDIMVLAPMRKGACGLEVLNEALQAKLNPTGAPIAVKNIRVGDRVIQNQNDYTHGREIMNGELGIVVGFDKASGLAKLEMDDDRLIEIPTADMDTFTLAWAISIHKFQGSQQRAIVCALSTAHYNMLSRSLLYTAVTRAQQLCVVVGEKKALQMSVGKVDSRRRNSTLALRIQSPEESGELF